MKTTEQIKTAIYTAVTTDAAIIANLGASPSTRFWWILKPEVVPTNEFATFQILDTVGSYVLGGCVNRSNEQVDVQITVYGTISAYAKLDALTEDFKRVMESLGYMLTASPELIDTTLNRPVRALRWVYQNV